MFDVAASVVRFSEQNVYKTLVSQGLYKVATVAHATTFSRAFISRASVHVTLVLAALLSSDTVSSSHIRRFATHRHCMCVNMFMSAHVCVQARAALAVVGLAYCCIIFGRIAPFLWRASLKSSGSLPLPLSGSGSPAKPSSADSLAAAAAQNLLDSWPVHGPALTALRYTQMAGQLVGPRCHWWPASGSGGFHPPPSLKTDTWRQCCGYVFMCLQQSQC